QFLKPTVITLVYGLGFGMLLVLMVVPALLGMQHDLARQMAALRRGLRFRAARVRAVLLAGVALLLAWFAVTMGAAMLTGALPGAVRALIPLAARMGAMPGGLLAFALGA